MSDFRLHSRTTALILIDLQNGIVGLPIAPHAAADVVARSAALANEFRSHDAPVIYVRVNLRELRHLPADKLSYDPNAPLPGASDSALVPDSGFRDGDFLITKRQWGAFHATEIDQQLRRLGIKTIVLAGLLTNFGVESTARAAFDLGYEIVFAEDACSSFSTEAHEFAMRSIFGFMGRVKQSSEIADALTEE